MSDAKPVAVVTSDCHLQPTTWSRHPDLKNDAYYSFGQIVDYCVNHDLPLILAGDVLDKRLPDPLTVGLLMEAVDELADHDIQVYFNQGQHEMSRSRPWLSCHKWPMWIHKQSLDIGPFRCYGLDFTPADTVKAELNAIPKRTHILIAHQVWSERMGPGMIFEASFSDIPVASVVISGDYHAHKLTTHRGKDGQVLTTVSPGSTYTIKTDEDNRKFFFVLREDGSFASVPLDTRYMYRYTIGTEKALDQLLGNLELKQHKVLGKPIIVVEYSDSIPNVRQRLVEAIKDTGHLFDKPIKQGVEVEEFNDTTEQEQVVSSTGLESVLSSQVSTDSPIYKTAVRLLRSNDVKSELKQIAMEAISDEESMEKTGVWSSTGGVNERCNTSQKQTQQEIGQDHQP